jgi:hypothetical protein
LSGSSCWRVNSRCGPPSHLTPAAPDGRFATGTRIGCQYTAKSRTREAAMAPFAKGGDGNKTLDAYLSGKLSRLVFQTVLSSGRSGRI